MNKIKAGCIKESYTWEGDNEQHTFAPVKLGLTYSFENMNGTYWLDLSDLPNPGDFVDEKGFCYESARGVEEKYFNEMFEII